MNSVVFPEPEWLPEDTRFGRIVRGIFDPKRHSCPPEMQVFYYERLHVPTNTKTTRAVVCFSQFEFECLLKHWTNDSWKYKEIVQTEQRLTSEEQNLIKDMLKFISNRPALEKEFQKEIKMQNQDFYNTLADSIFAKLQNGRLTITIS
jgi:hypothetical protein